MKFLLLLLFLTLTSAEQPEQNKKEIIVLEDPNLRIDMLQMEIRKARNEDSKTFQNVVFTRNTIKQLFTQ